MRLVLHCVIWFLSFTAYETLGNRIKRRSYDSVDSKFDDSVPSVSQNSKDNFFKEFSRAFDRNAV